MAQLYENLRQLITVVDELRDAGLSNYISLPRIAAIGTQSSGKSSAIETIVGRDFLPRGGGVVTRRPLELRLVHLSSVEYEGEQAWAIFDKQPDKKWTNFDEVRSQIERLTDEVAGRNKGIVNDPIVMTVYSTTAPDLTLIDLPGITRVPIRGSDQVEDIEKLTRDMTMHYVEDPRTIILAVLAANTDVSTSDALKIARTVDPQGVRTIGVITKIDIMDQGTDAASMLRGEDIALRLGYVGVKMRSQQEINDNKPIKQALQDEKEWFENHRVYSKLPPGHVGTKVLIEKLTMVLVKQIRHFLPEIKREISDRRVQVDRRIEELGQGVPLEDCERRQLMWEMITDYSEMFKNTIRGSYDRKLQRYLASAGAGGAGIEGGGSKIRAIMNDFLAEFVERSITYDMDDEDIERAIRMHEGDSLPGFPSPDTFEFLTLPLLQKITVPSTECVSTVSATLDAMAQRIGTVVLRRFPKLSEVVLEMTQNIIQRERDACRVIVEQQVACHTGYLFTNDPDYLGAHGTMEQMYGPDDKMAQQAYQEDPAEPGRLEKAGQQFKEGARAGYDKMAGMMGGAQNRKRSYNSPMVKEIRRRLDRYFDVMIRSIRDLVPKAIGFYLVRCVVDKLQFELLNSLNSSEKIDELLGEPPHILEERKQLNAQRIVLQKAHGVITRDPTLATAAFEAEMEAAEASAAAAAAKPSSGEFKPAERRSSGGVAGVGAKVAAGAAGAAHGASQLFSKTAGAAASAASAVKDTAQSAITRQASNAAAAAASDPYVQQQAASALVSAAQNPAMQKAMMSAAANTAPKAASAAASGLLGKLNPLGTKKGLFDDS